MPVPPKPITPKATSLRVPTDETLASRPPIPPPANIKESRYLSALEQSIQQSLQWVVFEPDNEQLWARVRDTIANFLFNEWRGGSLQGAKSDEAFFVRCDRSTMTQNDLDNGRLICLVGVAPTKPAEFLTFRISQFTADAKPPNP